MNLSMLADPHTTGDAAGCLSHCRWPQQSQVPGRQQEHGMLDSLEPPWVQRNPVSGRAQRAGPAAWGGTWGGARAPLPQLREWSSSTEHRHSR